jgi:hypothetical protein
MKYKEVFVEQFGIRTKHIIQDKGEGHFTSFPSDETNTDYQAYLKWVAEGNQPEPADEPSA